MKPIKDEAQWEKRKQLGHSCKEPSEKAGWHQRRTFWKAVKEQQE